ncbi:MAG: DNA/RNA non-specific endonuclease [Bacteroidaceae bacterium]|nr:DNA/RNA non-specific endonuclease [Bacteroidaceae bacterium]
MRTKRLYMPSVLNRQWAVIMFALCCVAIGFTACSSDDDEIDSELVNRNANDARKYPEAARMELPRLKGGVVNMLLVKKVSGNVNFCIEWDISKKAQRWAAFRWDTSYKDDNIGRTEAWSEDFEIPEAYRTSQSHYSGSGYTRGHIVASEDKQQLPLENNKQTFLYSNMHPQLNNFNTGIWQDLEKKVRTLRSLYIKYDSDTLYVCKGGTIDHSSDIIETTRSGLIVPKYFFMALLCKNKSSVNGGYKAIGFYLEHRDNYTNKERQELENYIVSIDQLEQLTGIDFFCNMPDGIEEKVESTVVPTAWGFQ